MDKESGKPESVVVPANSRLHKATHELSPRPRYGWRFHRELNSRISGKIVVSHRCFDQVAMDFMGHLPEGKYQFTLAESRYW